MQNLPLRVAGVTAMLVGAALGAAACAPAFQDARLVGPGRVQVTPGISGAGVSDEGESEYLVTTYAVQVEAGVAERLSVGMAYGRFDVDDNGGLNSVAFGPKVGIVRDRVAFAVPFSFAFGEDIEVSDTWELHPMALFTLPISDKVDFNPAARLLIPLCDECGLSDTLVGFNVGFGFRPRPSVSLRPEFGILVNPGESGVVWTFGLGVSLRPGG